ncbi:MAG: cupin [Cyclobacteriaceae bacterium]
MNTSSLIENIHYSEDKPNIHVLFETEGTKELRIVMRKGQAMKAHQSPHPITLEVFDGEINFGHPMGLKVLRKGDLISIDGGIIHDLKASVNSIMRLTLSKQDDPKRLVKAASN